MPNDYAEETGGALFNSGILEIKNTIFAENAAAGGLAIQNVQPSVVLLNVTFDGNVLSCPPQTYNYTQHVSTYCFYIVRSVTMFAAEVFSLCVVCTIHTSAITGCTVMAACCYIYTLGCVETLRYPTKA